MHFQAGRFGCAPTAPMEIFRLTMALAGTLHYRAVQSWHQRLHHQRCSDRLHQEAPETQEYLLS